MSYRADKLGDGWTDGLRDWRTGGQTQVTTIPEGQNWPRVKTITGMSMTIVILFELQIKSFWKYLILILQYCTSWDVSAPGFSFRIFVKYVTTRPLYATVFATRVCYTAWRSILMCNKSTSTGTSLDGTPMFAHVTLRRTFNPLGSKCPWWQDEEAAS